MAFFFNSIKLDVHVLVLFLLVLSKFTNRLVFEWAISRNEFRHQLNCLHQTPTQLLFTTERERRFIKYI
jgi:hypothetical protein